MKTAQSSRILQLTKKLCAIPSVSGSAAEENRCADFITHCLFCLAQKHPGRVRVFEPVCERDPLERKAVFGLLRAAVPTDKTVVLTGHFDVVDTQNCGDKVQTAFDLERYTEALREQPLDETARKDLESGNWLFGRGSMDMKAGLALFLASMEEWADDPTLAVNILFWAVPDEEANSAGMIGSLRTFLHICEEEHLKVVAALTGEPCFWTAETKTVPAVRPYYTGTTGKLMPFFYAFGKSAHIGNYLHGFSAALLISEIVCLAEADTALYEGSGLDLLAPPACLSMEVHCNGYSVTVPEEASAYFNVLTAAKKPADVLRWAQMTAARAAAQARSKLMRALLFAQDKGADFPDIDEVNVVTFGMLQRMARQKTGESFEEKRDHFYRSLPKDLDIREAALKECSWLFLQAQMPRPTIVVGFLPPYYPARLNRRQSPDEQKLRKVMEEMTEQAKVLSKDEAVRLHEVFGGITDLSFLGFEEMREGAKQVGENMAGWKKLFYLPTDLPGALDIPIANMGPAGRDAHRSTERLELDYSLNIAPKLLAETIQKLS